MTEVARAGEVQALSPDDGASIHKEGSTNNLHPPISRHESTLSLGSKEKVHFDEILLDNMGDPQYETVGHRRSSSGDKLSKFKPNFKKNDPPISKELSERARSAPLVKKFALPSTETLINDYSAALLKHILIHGRMYLSQNYICFESKIFGIKTMEVIPFKDVTHMAKRSKKLKFAHGIEVTTSSQTYYFASFVSREKAFGTLTKIWREHVPKTDLQPDGEDDDDDDDDGTGTGTQDYESDDSSLKKKDKKISKEHADLKLGRSIESQPSEHSEEREKGLRRFSSPLLSRVLPGSSASNNNGPSSKHATGTTSLSSSTTNLEQPEPEQVTSASVPPSPTITPANTSPPAAAPVLPSASAPTTPMPTPPQSEDEEEGLYGEGDGFLGSEAPFQQVLSKDFPVNVKTFFKIFFSDDSTFTKTYHSSRGDKDLVVNKWSNSPQFGLIRDVLFLSPVKVPLGPSHTRITETQRYHLTKSRLLIDTISMMLDIPYGDSFRVEGKWEVTLTSPESCKLVVNIGVHFMKKTWFKGKIETQTIKETKESFTQWAALAPSEITKYKAANPHPHHSTHSHSHSRPSSASSSSTSSLPAVQDASQPPSSSSAPPPSSVPSLSSSSGISSSTSTLTQSTTDISTSQQHQQQQHQQQSVSFQQQSSTISFEGARGRKSFDEGGKFARINRVFSSIPNPVSGFSLPTILLVLVFGLVFIHMYLRIVHLEGRVETLESILQPLVTKALARDKL